MAEHSYGELSDLVEKAKREATIAEMTCNGWELEGEDRFTKKENLGESYYSMSVSLDGTASGYSYSGGTGGDDPALAEVARTELNGIKEKWETNIDNVVDGWDRIDDPGKWDKLITSLQTATQKVAAGTGNDDSQFGNPDLTEIGFIRQRLSQNAGQTVEQFYRIYGPEKLELVLDGHCEVMGCLGVALTGQQKVWTTTRQDVATIMGSAVEAFKQTRDNNDTNWSALITVATAGAGLLAAFSTGVPGVAAAFSAAAATGGFLSASMTALGTETSEETIPAGGGGDYSGSHPDDVYDDLKTAFATLHERVTKQETNQQSMLSTMLGFVTDSANRPNFHIHSEAGLAPEFGGTDDIIDMKYSVLETIGYTSMPLIAKAFLESVDNAQAGDDQFTWYRPYASGIGANIGLGPYGPFDTWQSLLFAIFPVMNDTGAEVIRAGEHLAEAAGYVRDSDDWAREKVGKNYDDIKDAELGWQAPYEPPPPPPPPPGGGDQIPI